MTDDKVHRYLRSHWALTEIAAIVDDCQRPITFRTLQSWTTGQVLRIKPSLVVPGQRRKRYGLASLLNFLIAKRLLQGAGMPAKAVQDFIDHFGEEDFLEGAKFADKMSGFFILIQQDDKDAKILFFKDHRRFWTAVQVLITTDIPNRWATLQLDGVLNEALARIDCWNRRVEYKGVSIGDKTREALKAIRDSNLSKDLPANAPL